MVDRTTGLQSKTKTGSLTRLLQESIGKQLRSVYEIDRQIPEHIFRLLRLFDRPPRERSINPAPSDPKVDGTSDDGLFEQRARHDRSSEV
jgi:hypothetical protein